MHSEATETPETLHCADCGRSGDATTITLHSGAVSARGDEGRVRHTQVALCSNCAAQRLEILEAALL
jgi:recombinational DNA repair protein (RecF pathway)